MAGGKHDGHINLENELTCSICTSILFQPLTLLDCLHTFCGACLKDWFGFQATSATSLHPYTCPSCRASVRATKPNASYNTLLDMFLQVNPGRGKSEEEKEEDRQKYKAGENVLPKLRRRRSAPQVAPRVVQEERHRQPARQDHSVEAVPQSNLLQVRDSDGPASSHDGRRPGSSHENPAAQRQARGSSHPAQSGETQQQGSSPPPTSPSNSATRHIEHQASLRSLMSSSSVDSEEMADRIMRQIAEEGLLEGIDLDAINIDQEDALSERIAQAYRRRVAEQRRAIVGASSGNTNPRVATTMITPASMVPAAAVQQDVPVSAENSTSAASARPPVSRPHLIDAVNRGRAPQGRSASQDSSQPHRRSQSQNARNAEQGGALPATALINPPNASSLEGRAGETRPTRPLHDRRRSTDPERSRRRSQSQSTNSSTVRNLWPDVVLSESNSSNNNANVIPADPTPRTGPRVGSSTFPTTHHSRPSSRSVNTLNPAANVSQPASSGSRPSSSHSQIPLFPEPKINCKQCGKNDIEYDLHYKCYRCDSGDYHVCLSCYRAGKGCRHWFGFGTAAQQRYELRAPTGGYPPNHEQPHLLTGQRYLRPTQRLVASPSSAQNGQLGTAEDPARRLQSGVFCAICSAFANTCYWKCDTCNEGDWGYCNKCVNQSKHCTHPLLPLMHRRSTTNSTSNPIRSSFNGSLDVASSPPSSPSLIPKAASVVRGPGLITLANSVFVPLTFSARCDICKYPIPPSRTRFSCSKCNEGDYDICTPCYTSASSRGAISPENGHQGWRRCLKGHRMIVVGFEDRDGGQRRIVVKDLVGGHALDEESAFIEQVADLSPRDNDLTWRWKEVDGSISKTRADHFPSVPQGSEGKSTARTIYPPDGGEGFRAVAKWSYFPIDASSNDLTFPKNAEIREVHDINGDWYWGVYCGSKGLIPEGYVRIAL